MNGYSVDMSETRVRKSGAQRETTGIRLMASGALLGVVAFLIHARGLGIIVGGALVLVGLVMWAAGMARSD